MHPIEVLKRCSGVIPTQVDIFDTASYERNLDAIVTATYELDNAGTGHANSQPDWTWLLYGSPSDYTVRAVLNSGSTPSGSALNSWLNLATTRSWYLANSVRHSIDTCQITVTIRRVVDMVEIDSAVITITSENQ